MPGMIHVNRIGNSSVPIGRSISGLRETPGPPRM